MVAQTVDWLLRAAIDGLKKHASLEVANEIRHGKIDGTFTKLTNENGERKNT